MAGTRWRRAPDALWRESPDALIVKAPVSDVEPVAVSGAAAHLWDLLAEPHTTDELAEALAELHHADADVVRTDIEPVLASLCDHHVVERLP
ncbi:MAG: PqqD family protein [Acidimicrobiales bacterium]